MSVTSTNYYTSSGSDLISVFNAYTSGNKASTTSYKVNGTDLSDIFQAYTSGETKAETTGISVNGSDLNNIFQIKAYTISGSPTYSSYTSNGYTVLVFTTSTTGSISFSSDKTVNYIVVGSGGNGGFNGVPQGVGGRSYYGGGGGGGGMVSLGAKIAVSNANLAIRVSTSGGEWSTFGNVTSLGGTSGGNGGSGGIGGNGGTGGGKGGDGGIYSTVSSTNGSNGTYIGGLGITVTINNVTYTYLAGGGGGGSYFAQGLSTASSGGISGGGGNDQRGTANTGGGGGGAVGKSSISRNGYGATGVIILYFM